MVTREVTVKVELTPKLIRALEAHLGHCVIQNLGTHDPFQIRSNDGGLRCSDFLADVAEVFARHRVRVYENEFDETVLHHETHEDGCSWLLVLEDFVDSLKSSQEKRGD